jgi:hypothetical protein
MSKKIIFYIVVLTLASTSYAATPFMFGNWEDHNDHFRDWGNQSVYIDDPVMAGKYTYTTTGHTLNSKAVKMDAGIGWQQNLSIKSYESPYGGFIQGPAMPRSSLTPRVLVYRGPVWADLTRIQVTPVIQAAGTTSISAKSTPGRCFGR